MMQLSPIRIYAYSCAPDALFRVVPAKLERHLHAKHVESKGKSIEYFKRKSNEDAFSN